MPDVFIAPPEDLKKIESNLDTPVETEVENRAQGEPAKKSFSPVAALMINPPDVNFQTQEQDEQVVLLLRRHWITNIPWIFIGSLMLLAPFIFSIFFPLLNIPLKLPGSVLIVIWCFWYLLTFGYFFINFLIWYFNAYIVTNERVVDIDFYNLTYKQVAATRIGRIQDVTFKVGGVIRGIFDYGDVFVQTAGEELNFDFLAVPKPSFVADKIGDLMETAGKKDI